jgi:hypothetical protein
MINVISISLNSSNDALLLSEILRKWRSRHVTDELFRRVAMTLHFLHQLENFVEIFLRHFAVAADVGSLELEADVLRYFELLVVVVELGLGQAGSVIGKPIRIFSGELFQGRIEKFLNLFFLEFKNFISFQILVLRIFNFCILR